MLGAHRIALSTRDKIADICFSRSPNRISRMGAIRECLLLGTHFMKDGGLIPNSQPSRHHQHSLNSLDRFDN